MGSIIFYNILKLRPGMSMDLLSRFCFLSVFPASYAAEPTSRIDFSTRAWACLPAPHHEPRPASTSSYKRPNLTLDSGSGCEPPSPFAQFHSPQPTAPNGVTGWPDPGKMGRSDPPNSLISNSGVFGLNPHRLLWSFTASSKRPLKFLFLQNG